MSKVINLERTLYVLQIKRRGIWETFGLAIIGKSRAQKVLNEEQVKALALGRHESIRMRTVPKTYADAYKQGVKDARSQEAGEEEDRSLQRA